MIPDTIVYVRKKDTKRPFSFWRSSNDSTVRSNELRDSQSQNWSLVKEVGKLAVGLRLFVSRLEDFAVP